MTLEYAPSMFPCDCCGEDFPTSMLFNNGFSSMMVCKNCEEEIERDFEMIARGIEDERD